jgi:coproporphyrinogen III oxidase-like Fe-S oxidoreductase
VRPVLDGSPYQGYLYAYPHKTAYRPLRPRPRLSDVWSSERRDALFLYVHVPFCEMRCGFCNLFTRSRPPAEQVRAYLEQLRHEVDAVRAAVGRATYALGAIGGGTPTYLDPSELASLFGLLSSLGASADGRSASSRAGGIPLSVETSPATATPDRLEVLMAHGVRRISLGVQSFLDAEAHAAGRPQRRSDVDRALTALRDARVPVLNLDLIYGIPGQTASTWARSLAETLRWAPEEVYLYPLYVRPLTGLGRRPVKDTDAADAQWDRQRLALYRQGRDVLREAGYEQLSMRQFRRGGASAPPVDYDCQDDGMVGIGCGARSYTTDLHYSFDYAVSVGGVRAVLDDYLRRPPADFGYAEVGFRLDTDEQRRRWLVKTLLRADGVSQKAWHNRFGVPLPPLEPLSEKGWLGSDEDRVWLTDEGLAHSDAIGPWLVSPAVRNAMGEYALR